MTTLMPRPYISIVVVFYDMPWQAANTLYSLSSHYQKSIDAGDYEILAIENNSKRNLGKDAALAIDSNIKYLLRDEPSPSPVAAINEGIDLAQGEFLGLMIDGARMLSPGVLHLAEQATRAMDNPLVMIPGYHLGGEKSFEQGYSEANDQQLLEQLNWKYDGYELFSRASMSPGNENGYMNPFMESSLLFAARQAFINIGCANKDFNLAGGGSINLHMMRQLGIEQNLNPVVLVGEGSFHQHHGGVTTSDSANKRELIEQFQQQLDSYWNGQFEGLRKEPVMLGALPFQAYEYMHFSASKALTSSTG